VSGLSRIPSVRQAGSSGLQKGQFDLQAIPQRAKIPDSLRSAGMAGRTIVGLTCDA
jgi:hypothetical protein